MFKSISINQSINHKLNDSEAPSSQEQGLGVHLGPTANSYPGLLSDQSNVPNTLLRHHYIIHLHILYNQGLMQSLLGLIPDYGHLKGHYTTYTMVNCQRGKIRLLI